MQLARAEGGRLARTGLSLVLALGLTCAFPIGGIAATTGDGTDAADAPAASIRVGLVKEQGHWRYYRKSGELLKASWKKVSGRRYYFDAAGNAKVGAAKVGGRRYVFDAKGRLLAPKKNRFVKVGGKIFYVDKKGQPAASGWLLKKSTFYYVKKTGRVVTDSTVDGIKLGSDGRSKDDSASRLKLATIRRIEKLTTPSMSRRTKLKRCFSWLWSRPFVNSTTPKDIGKRGWAQRCAMKVLKTGNLECWGHACTFAMMAYELGCEPRIVGLKHVHAYVMIGSERWDNMASKPHISGTSTWKVVSWRDTSPKVWGEYAEQAKAKKKAAQASKATSGSTGFRTVKGELRYYKNGAMLKKKWLTLDGKTYYFGKKGNAATGSVKLKRKGYEKCYWVFKANHVLSVGKKVHDVKVVGKTYRVRKDGRAFTGWTSGSKKYYLASGELATGVWVVDGKLEGFGATGMHDTELSTSLQAVTVRNGDPTGLLALLGGAESVDETPNSCYAYLGMQGSDVAYAYAHVTVNVFAAEDGNAYLESVV